VFNLREFTAEYDRLPKRVMEPFSEGPIAGSEIAEEELSWFMHRYYELMGCHPETGEPTDECLRELGLDNLLA
jgi:aldehyde:ferredoxin oxidoreductase